MRPVSLRFKLVGAFLAIVVVSITIVAAFNGQTIRRQLISDVGEDLQDLAGSKAQAVGDLLAKQADTLEALSVNRVLQDELEAQSQTAVPPSEAGALSSQQWQTLLANDMSHELLRFRNNFPDNFEVLVTNDQGMLVAATNPTPDSYFGDETWWRAAYKEGRGTLFIGPTAAADAVILAQPVYGRQTQRVVGVLRSTFSLDALTDMLLFEEMGRAGRVDLYLPDGGLMIPQANGLNHVTPDATLGNRLAQLASGDLVFSEAVYDGRTSLISQSPVFTTDPGSRLPVAGLNWRIIAHEDRAAALQAVSAAGRTTFITSLVALALTGVMALIVAHYLVQPVTRLSQTVNRVAQGDLNARTPVASQDEIGLLATTFNHMTGELQQTMAALTRRTHMLATSAEVAQAASASLELDQVLHTSVALICERFGYYHASVFLIEPGSDTAVLRESYGEVGAIFRKSGHQLHVGSQSLVGQATASRQPYVAQNVAEDPMHFKHPLLPTTRAEAVFPLLVGELVIGALDVQSKRTDAFPPDVVALLQTVANQVAVAVQHAWLYAEQIAVAERFAEADRMKTQFLTNMSHELRTPLNSIIGFSRLLLKGIDGPLNENQYESIDTVHRNGQHLLGLINNILDLSKIEAGKVELIYEAVDVPQMMAVTAATTEGLLKGKPISLTVSVPAGLPPISADPLRLRQILLNLVANAAKFTDEGAIVLAVSDSEDGLTFSVADTGIGIPPAQQEAIFREFMQVDGASNRVYEGTGLGLPITKRLVEMHGGRIWLTSAPGVGSTFWVWLPWEKRGGERPYPHRRAINHSRPRELAAIV
ncbi:MAG: HAMP domain-containing protein [Chloroflexi bacterium]|nr:HAMP domain-containing protein [Chloroflexota bacterium]